MPLANGLVVGDRVTGPVGLVGTVIGPPTRSAMRAVSVQVRWDVGGESDERAQNLRVASGAARRNVSSGAVTSNRPATSGSAMGTGPFPKGERPGSAQSGGGALRPASATPARGKAAGSPGSPTGAGASASNSPQKRRPLQEREVLAGGFQFGDRVTGPGGTGIVVGPPSRSAIAQVAVAIRWDGVAATADARVGTLTRRSDPSFAAASSPHPGAGLSEGGHGAAGDGMGSLLPFTRRRSTLPGDANPADLLREHYGLQDIEEASDSWSNASSNLDVHGRAAQDKRSSQAGYADRMQTVIVYDWDDTLFPTSFLFDNLRLDLAVPLAQQRRLGARAKEITRKIAKCESHAAKILQQSHLAGQVVVVTLAVKGWVEQACRCFYPKVGEILRSLKIKVVSARQEQTNGKVNVSKGLVKAKCRSEEEYWGLLKGQAISKEIQECYSQYEGQTWKNVISIGDSQFERYGLLAASTAYMQGKRMSQLDTQPFAPGQQGAWKKMEVSSTGEHEIKLRVKCCKLLGDPDMDELAVELSTIAKWLDSMVKLDEGFDIDFEALKDVEQVALVEGVLRGERPVRDLPDTRPAFG